MTEQKTDQDGLADAAAENAPSASGNERPGSGAQRRVDPSEPTPAANQRAGERSVGSDDQPDGRMAPAEQGAPGSSENQPSITETGDVPARRQGASDAGSSAAAAGEVPVPGVDPTSDDPAGAAATHERAVTGVHRPSAPSGEVSPT